MNGSVLEVHGVTPDLAHFRSRSVTCHVGVGKDGSRCETTDMRWVGGRR